MLLDFRLAFYAGFREVKRWVECALPLSLSFSASAQLNYDVIPFPSLSLSKPTQANLTLEPEGVQNVCCHGYHSHHQ